MKRGDVVLVFLPFVGATGGKLRPAVIVQNDTLNAAIRETVIVEVTSNLAHVTKPHQVLIERTTPEGAASGLLRDSAIRCERLHTIPQADVVRKIGSLSTTYIRQVDAAVKAALGIH